MDAGGLAMIALENKRELAFREVTAEALPLPLGILAPKLRFSVGIPGLNPTVPLALGVGSDILT
jgi:hypothetical protein